MPPYGVLVGRNQAMADAKRRAKALGHRLTAFRPHKPAPFSPILIDEYRAECAICHEEVFVAYKGLDWKVTEATTYQTTCAGR